MKPAFTYSGNVIKVVDGDTIDVNIDLGFSIFTITRFRLYGIDTPEKSDKNVDIQNLAIAATKFVKDKIEGKTVTIESMNKDKYGRWLANVHFNDETTTINEQLVTLGMAKPYFGDNKINLGWDTPITKV